MFTLPLLFGWVPFLQRKGRKNALKNRGMPLIKEKAFWALGLFTKIRPFNFFLIFFQWVWLCKK
jgi:hypothetical protein